MRRKVKFQEGGEVSAPPARRSAITNDPVGTRLRGFFSGFGQRPPEEQDLLDAWRTQTPVDVVRARRLEREAQMPTPPPPPPPRTTASPTPATPPPSARPTVRGGAVVGEGMGPVPGPARAYLNSEVDRIAREMPAGPNVEVERRNARRRAAPARREMTADELNAMVLRQLGREPFETVPATREATGPAAERARSRIAERMSQEVQPYKKGGMVKPKAAPKKMTKGGMVAKPTVKGKVKPKGKVMPAFKKGGKVAMKGKK